MEANLLDSEQIALLDQPDPFQRRLWLAALQSQAIQVITRESQEPLESLLVRYRPQLLVLDMHSAQRTEPNPYSFCRQCRQLYPELQLLLTNYRKPQVESVEVRWAKYQGAANLLPGFRRVSDVIYAARLVNELFAGSNQPIDLAVLKRQVTQATQEAKNQPPSLLEAPTSTRSLPKYPGLIERLPVKEMGWGLAAQARARLHLEPQPLLLEADSLSLSNPVEAELVDASADRSAEDPLDSIVELLDEAYPPALRPDPTVAAPAPVKFPRKGQEPQRPATSNASMAKPLQLLKSISPPQPEPNASTGADLRPMFRGRPIESDPRTAAQPQPNAAPEPLQPEPLPLQRSVLRFLKRIRPGEGE